MSGATTTTILRKVNEIERNLQELKIDLMAGAVKKKEFGSYKESEILKETGKIRKKLWNEKYSKAI